MRWESDISDFPRHFADRTRRLPEGKPRAEQPGLPRTALCTPGEYISTWLDEVGALPGRENPNKSYRAL